eukprot:8467530-Prorocentrum_lima.AAC.1
MDTTMPLGYHHRRDHRYKKHPWPLVSIQLQHIVYTAITTQRMHTSKAWIQTLTPSQMGMRQMGTP